MLCVAVRAGYNIHGWRKRESLIVAFPQTNLRVAPSDTSPQKRYRHQNDSGCHPQLPLREGHPLPWVVNSGQNRQTPGIGGAQPLRRNL